MELKRRAQTHEGFLNGRQGFTLLEVLVAMAIATIGLLGMALLQGTAIQGNNSGSKFTQATMLAQSSIENLHSELLDGNGATETDLADGSGDEEVGIDENGEPGGVFTRTWNVEDYTTFSRRVTVEVQWNEGGRARQVAMSTITRGRGN